MNQLEVLLSAWGRWAIAGESKGLGYASICPMFRDARPSRTYESAPPSGYSPQDFEAVTQAISVLPVFHAVAVVVYYQQSDSVRDAASKLGVDHKAASRYIEDAKRRLIPLL
jgi:DNA-directed RNA polymerase specialized sigma24 family protein